MTSADAERWIAGMVEVRVAILGEGFQLHGNEKDVNTEVLYPLSFILYVKFSTMCSVLIVDLSGFVVVSPEEVGAEDYLFPLLFPLRL